jgi:hypothetical protein
VFGFILPLRVRRPEPVIRRVVELVVVHGMGRQRANETLLEWAEPVLRRIDWIARQCPVPGRTPPDDDPSGESSEVRFGEVIVSTEGEGVVNAVVDYVGPDGRRRNLRLRVTEARWSQSFLEMKRGEIFTWGLSFAPRTLGRLGSHYTRVIWYGSRHHPIATLVPGMIGIAALWVVLAALGTVGAVFLAIAGPLLFIPLFRPALQAIVDTLVEFVGDVAVWNRRPVRAAAMRLVVREAVVQARRRLRDTVRRHPDQETELIVLAHSQGAAVTASMLFSNELREPRVEVDTFVSVGAAVTLLGSPSWDGISRPANRADAVAASPVNIVRAWAKNHPDTRWLNYWGIWDPFAAGPISTGAAGRKQRWWLTLGIPRVLFPGSTFIGPEEHAVHNTSWPLTDHQSYSSNFVQVIDPVARLVMDLPGEGRSAGAQTMEPSSLRNALHARAVREYGTQRLLVLALGVSCLAVPGLYLFLRSHLLPLSGWLRKWVGILLKQDATTGLLGWLTARTWFVPTLLAIAVLSLGLWLNSLLWHRYAGRIAWAKPDRLPAGRWVAGAILRSCLVLLLGVGNVAAVLLLPGTGAVAIVIAGLLVAAAVWIVVAPWLGSLPVVVPENRRGIND